jgi:HEPN domain-containing protein
MNRTAEAYLNLSKDDIAAARRLLPDHSRHAAFWVQQAAEKLVRAVIEAEGAGPVERGHEHQIAILAEYLGSGHDFYYDFQRLDRTSSFATQTRYPSATGRVTDPPEVRVLEDLTREIESLHDDVREHCQDLSHGSKGP